MNPEPNGRHAACSALGGPPPEAQAIDRSDAQEELSGLRKVAGPLHEVAEHIPLAEMPFRRVPDQAARPGFDQQGDGTGQIAAVGPGAGQHQPALGEHFRVG
jgi:hypothetical protein